MSIAVSRRRGACAPFAVVLALTFAALGSPRIALAQPGYAPAAASAPSPFHYAFRGMLLGAVGGLAVGYLVADDRGTWEPYVYGSGIGAIAGGVLGLTVGLVNLDSPGVGHYVLRDAVYGSAFGGLVGAIAGGLAGRDAESVGVGASIGVLAGTGVGAIIGIIEERSHRPRHAANQPGLQLTLASARDGNFHTVWMPALLGRY